MNDDKKINKKMIFDEDFLKICQFQFCLVMEFPLLINLNHIPQLEGNESLSPPPPPPQPRWTTSTSTISRNTVHWQH